MIGALRGRIIEITQDGILLDVSGVGYQAYVPARILAGFNKDDQIFLHIHTQVREDDISLFGFNNISDKQMFLLLNKVSGVGAKTALNILGVMGSSEISDAISFEDKASFTRISGIGPKAAVRIINDLKDKVDKVLVDTAPIVSSKLGDTEISVASNTNQRLKDALSALENLGYQKVQILDLVKNIAAEEEDLSEIITKSLRLLAK